MPIYFYSIREKPYGCFSNFSHYGFDLDGQWWPTSEHYFQAQKFREATHAAMVRQARTPSEAARLGRNRRFPFREDWEQIKDAVMYRGVLRKFEANLSIRSVLCSTGDNIIIENLPKDYYWSCGSDGSGKNRLGQILMQVRTDIRRDLG